MPRLIALKDNTLPEGIIGPPVVAVGRLVTVSQEEALRLLEAGGWALYAPGQQVTAPMLDKVVLAPAATKAVGPPEKEACDNGADNN